MNMLYTLFNLSKIPEPVFAHVYSCPGYESTFKRMAPNIEIAYIKEGTIQVEVEEGISVTAKENGFLILPHNHAFVIKSGKDQSHIHYTISAMIDEDCRLLSEPAHPTGKNEICLPLYIEPNKNTEKIAQMMYEAISVYQQGDKLSTIKSGSLVARVLCELCDAMSEKENENRSKKTEILDSRIKKYIEKNIRTKILLTDIADALGKNANYLNQVFKKKNNMSIISYVNLEKTKKAAVLIIDKGYSAKEAAKEMGISDVSYLSRMFKKKMGMSISDYKSASVDYTFSLADKERIKGT